MGENVNVESLRIREQNFCVRATKVCDTWEEVKEAFDLQFPNRAKKISAYVIWSWCKRNNFPVRDANAIPPKRNHTGAPKAERAVYAAWLIEHSPRHGSWASLVNEFNSEFGTKHSPSWAVLLTKRAGVELEFQPSVYRRRRAKQDKVAPPKKKEELKAAAVKLKRPNGSTLCEFCVHAVPNHGPRRDLQKGEEPHGCNWSIHLEPVEGWKIKKSGETNLRVVSCPQFVDDLSWCR